MNILILGGDGFIGSHLANFLRHEHNVTIVDKEDLRSSRLGFYPDQYIYCDLSVDTNHDITRIVKQTKPDFVFNCVAVATPHYYVKYPIDTFNLDFTINYNIIKALISHNLPFMHFSSSEVYGKKWFDIYQEDKTDLIIGPTHKLRWIYATSKILLEQLLNAHNNNYCIVRPQNFFGWDMDWIPAINTNIDNKWKPRLPACILNSLFSKSPLYIVKPGTQRRCYTYIDDAIQGLWSIVKNWDKCKNQTFNVGNNQNEIPIKNFILLYRQIWNEQCPIEYKNTYHPIYVEGTEFYGEGYEDCERRLFDDEKIVSLTGWKPQTNINDAITKTVMDALHNYKGYLK
jgi:nucleoside-diphosphate-sugar epimerase